MRLKSAELANSPSFSLSLFSLSFRVVHCRRWRWRWWSRCWRLWWWWRSLFVAIYGNVTMGIFAQGAERKRTLYSGAEEGRRKPLNVGRTKVEEVPTEVHVCSTNPTDERDIANKGKRRTDANPMDAAEVLHSKRLQPAFLVHWNASQPIDLSTVNAYWSVCGWSSL